MARKKDLETGQKAPKPRLIITVGRSRTTRAIPAKGKPKQTKPQHDAHVARLKQFIAGMTLRERRAYQASLEISARRRHRQEIMSKRLEATGEEGKHAEQRQREILKALGISSEAGFDGAPPAFQAREFAVGNRKELVLYCNVSKDQAYRLLENRVIEPRQYRAALRFVKVVEAFESVGLRAAGLQEAVDGGRQVDVSEAALWASTQLDGLKRGMPGDLFELTRTAMAMSVPIAAIARTGRWGLSRNTVVNHLREALDWLVDWYGISAGKEA